MGASSSLTDGVEAPLYSLKETLMPNDLRFGEEMLINMPVKLQKC